jgi:LAO/AO transport system kinase
VTETAPESLVRAAHLGDRRAIGRVVSALESTDDPHPWIRELAAQRARREPALVVGLTGAPGAGKSSMLAALCPRVLDHLASVRIAVLAVDPSSAWSGGALLGDRVRFDPTPHPRLFVRSQANEAHAGGVTARTGDVVRGLEHLFDLVFVESVGVGQSETSIGALADEVWLAVQANAGDGLQALKAGVMELPDAIAFTKADLAGAAAGRRALTQLARSGMGDAIPVIPTSVHGQGLDAWVERVARGIEGERRDRVARDRALFALWVATEFGASGTRAFHSDLAGFDHTQSAPRTAFRDRFARWLAATR